MGITCQTRVPTASTNRQCSNVNVCSGTEYMKVAPTLAHNGCGTCAAHTVCDDSQYESVDETPTSDRECELKECTACANGNMATGKACPSHGGTTCASCDDGFYLSDGNCVAQPLCGAGEKISAYSTTQAGTCGACGANEYQDATSHRHTACKAQPTCGAGQRMSSDTSIAVRTVSYTHLTLPTIFRV